MKLLQWVHRKLRNNSIDPFKDFSLGNPCNCLNVQPTHDNQYSHPKSSFSSINQPCFKDNGEEDKLSELFEGFLTIGTLGAETVPNEPATPTFDAPFEDTTTATNNAEVTENDLKLITYELEKFLEAEKEKTFKESPSVRNINVSTTTEPCDKQRVGSEAEDYANKTVRPLQGYLLGSSVELPETQAKKDRVSLVELFHKTKTTQDCAETGVKGETQAKQTHKSAIHLMRKMLKKVHISSKTSNSHEDDADSASTSKKLHKVLRMFHRKVYPESTINSKDFIKPNKDELKNVNHEYGDGKSTNPDRGGNVNPQSQHGGNNEHWIKTDTEYLVLEL